MQMLEGKVPPIILIVLFIILMWLLSLLTPRLEVNHLIRLCLSVLILLIAGFFCLAGVISFKKARTTVNPLKPDMASSLVSRGIYSRSRNPMYVGFALVLTAWAIYLLSPWSLIGVLGFITYMNRFQIAPEEQALTKIFGDEYRDYQSKVRRWL